MFDYHDCNDDCETTPEGEQVHAHPTYSCNGSADPCTACRVARWLRWAIYGQAQTLTNGGRHDDAAIE